jgi:WASH complex subunit 7
VRPLRLAHTTVHIRTRVEDYLNATFHNHTALALHNWKTYGEMRKLAQEKYGISLAEITLPGQTLEQGLDVLEVMRNIHLFVAKYHYNLHSQVSRCSCASRGSAGEEPG